jgi:hypothetical protein
VCGTGEVNFSERVGQEEQSAEVKLYAVMTGHSLTREKRTFWAVHGSAKGEMRFAGSAAGEKCHVNAKYVI